MVRTKLPSTVELPTPRVEYSDYVRGGLKVLRSFTCTEYIIVLTYRRAELHILSLFGSTSSKEKEEIKLAASNSTVVHHVKLVHPINIFDVSSSLSLVLGNT